MSLEEIVDVVQSGGRNVNNIDDITPVGDSGLGVMVHFMTCETPGTEGVVFKASEGSATSASQTPSVKEDVYATADERTTRLVESGQISLDVKLATFIVNGSTEPRFVQLFPKELCSCPAKNNCYHVIAAKRAIGLRHEVSARCNVSLTQLRRNKRKKVDKTCRRKRPRVDDVGVVAAGDRDPDVINALTQVIAAQESVENIQQQSVPNDFQFSSMSITICRGCRQLARS